MMKTYANLLYVHMYKCIYLYYNGEKTTAVSISMEIMYKQRFT